MAKYCEVCGSKIKFIDGEWKLNDKRACYECWRKAQGSASFDLLNKHIDETNNNTQPDGTSKKNSIGCLGWFAIILIVIGVLISMSGVGAVYGVPVAGIGGIGYLVCRAGTASLSSKGCAISLLVFISIVIILIATTVTSVTR